jgi:hypothetical protein
MPENPSPPGPIPAPPVPPPEPLPPNPSPPVAKLSRRPLGDATLPKGKRLQPYFAGGNKKRSAGSTLAAQAASL